MQFRQVANATHPQMHVRRCALSLDLVCPSSDQDREHIAPSQHCIHLHFATVQSTMPACFFPLEFKPVAFAVDGNVVDHKKLGSCVDARLAAEEARMILLNPTLLLLPLASNLRQQCHSLVRSQSQMSFHLQRPPTSDPTSRIFRQRWPQPPRLHAGRAEAPPSIIDPDSQCPLFPPENRHRSECG